MIKSIVMVFVGLSMVIYSPAFARSHHNHRSSAPAHNAPVYGAWKAPYPLPSGFGPNDVPFAPF
jgi:hypothetical protein